MKDMIENIGIWVVYTDPDDDAINVELFQTKKNAIKYMKSLLCDDDLMMESANFLLPNNIKNRYKLDETERDKITVIRKADGELIEYPFAFLQHAI